MTSVQLWAERERDPSHCFVGHRPAGLDGAAGIPPAKLTVLEHGQKYHHEFRKRTVDGQAGSPD